MIQEIKEGYVKIEREHGIATIEFFHPQSNSLPGKLLEELAQTIHGEGNEPDTGHGGRGKHILESWCKWMDQFTSGLKIVYQYQSIAV